MHCHFFINFLKKLLTYGIIDDIINAYQINRYYKIWRGDCFMKTLLKEIRHNFRNGRMCFC